MMGTDYGKRLKKARKHAGFTQKQLGPMVGMSQSNLSDLENTAYSSGYTAQLAAACNVDAQWLAVGDGEMTIGPATQAAAAHNPPATDLAAALATVLAALVAAPPLRWAAIRAQLDWVVEHPEMLDAAVPEMMHLITARTSKRLSAC